MLTREALIEKGKRKVVSRDVPGVGQVYLRSLSEAEYSQYQADSVDTESGRITPAGFASAKRRLVALVLADAEGNRLFANSDLGVLADLDAGLVAKLGAACEAFVNGEDSEKNFEATSGASLPTG